MGIDIDRQIPDDLACLLDAICEGLPDNEARTWPGRFLAQVTWSADLRQVCDRFVLWLLSGAVSPIAEWTDRALIRAVADLYRRRLDGDEPTEAEWEAAGSAAAAVAWEVWESSRGTSPAAQAAWAAAQAAWAAGRFARVAQAAQAAEHCAASRNAAWRTMADKLEQLIKAAPRRLAQLGGTTNE